jgi:hypothetical protein
MEYIYCEISSINNETLAICTFLLVVAYLLYYMHRFP